MKESTERLLEKVDKEHDWIEGQMYSGGGLEYHKTDVCQVCGLRRHYKEDEQNGIEGFYRFSDGETGQDLSLRQAVERKCLPEG